MNIQLTKRLLLVTAALSAAVIAGCSANSTAPTSLTNSEPSQEISTPGIVTSSGLDEFDPNDLTFLTERNESGDLVAVPLGLPASQYSINSSPVVELHDISYLNVNLFYGDHNSINALIAHDPATGKVETLWSETLSSSDNHWNNAFLGSYQFLLPLDDQRLLFLEPELHGEGGQYHVSAYDTQTGNVEQLRSDFWPLVEEFDYDYDYIYAFNWSEEKQQLFMQSYLGNVWFFDLQAGKDHVHSWKYRVIPHSTTGMPSLFLSPTFERFVFDDESGKLGVYNQQGGLLNTIALPVDHYVPSEKMKWNPAGTVAWMEESEAESYRILDIDIDYMQIAPQQVHFYDQDGHPLGTIQAEDFSKKNALEIAGWMNDKVAVVKTYSVVSGALDGSTAKVENEAYYLYDIQSKKKGATTEIMPEGAIPVTNFRVYPVEKASSVTVNYDEIIFRKK